MAANVLPSCGIRDAPAGRRRAVKPGKEASAPWSGAVPPGREDEILTAMKGYKDYSVAFARSLILKPAPSAG